MDALRAELAARKKETKEVFGTKRYMKRSELEELRLKRSREEKDPAPNEPSAATPANPPSPSPPPAASMPKLTVEEVRRRLRRLGEPATLFGESDAERLVRLAAAEKNLAVEDEEKGGGQQANVHAELAREARARLRGGAESQPPRGEGSSRAREGVPGAAKLGAAKPGAEDASASASSGADGALEASTTPEQERLARAFAVAAAKVQRASLPIEDRLSVWVKGLCADWEADLEGRSSDSKATPSGRQATVRFAETQQYFKPLHARLRRRDLEPEMVASLKLIMDAVEERNYLHAYKIYMGLAVGNSPWPIGVTQVGLHERSAREKISFNSNMTKAHIMNDEATRKFIQALKRLMTFAQRRYPTDPSRSVDFNGFEDSSRGAFGGGSDRLALLEAMKQGADVCPAPSPSVVDETGGVKIPMRWEHQIRGALAQVSASRETEKAQP